MAPARRLNFFNSLSLPARFFKYGQRAKIPVQQGNDLLSCAGITASEQPVPYAEGNALFVRPGDGLRIVRACRDVAENDTDRLIRIVRLLRMVQASVELE